MQSLLSHTWGFYEHVTPPRFSAVAAALSVSAQHLAPEPLELKERNTLD